ncbi:MAG: DUF2459 domain-containing protein [Hellea sp.]|nr:DUF2459 domain-containing protein [Hellea sp.]
MRRFLKWIRNALALILAFAASYGLIAFVLSAITVPAKPVACEARTPVYLQHSAVHVDFVFPVDTLSQETKEQVSLPSDPDYLVFGLGDRDIYINTPTWGDLKARYALKALFVPSSRALHVEPAFRESGDWIKLELCESQRAELEKFVMNSFRRTDAGKVIVLEGLSYTGHDRFYEATGTYTLFNSCNNWANRGLKAAGLKAPIWSPFAQGVIYHAKRQN